MKTLKELILLTITIFIILFGAHQLTKRAYFRGCMALADELVELQPPSETKEVLKSMLLVECQDKAKELKIFSDF